MTVLLNNEAVDFDIAVNLMDSDIREALHNELSPCSEQEFMDAYADAHQKKYGEEFMVN